MNRRSTLARILIIDGILLLVIAILYFVLTNMAIKWLAYRLAPAEYTEVAPQFLLNHIAVGILLFPLALTTFYCAWGVSKGYHWSRVVSLANGVSMLALPAALSWFMGAQYYSSIIFLLAALLMAVIGVSMLLPAVWFPKDTGTHDHVQGPEEKPHSQ